MNFECCWDFVVVEITINISTISQINKKLKSYFVLNEIELYNKDNIDQC